MAHHEYDYNNSETKREIETVEDIETVDQKAHTPVSHGSAETIRVTGEYPSFAPDMFRFGRGRFRTVEFIVKNPDHIFSLRSQEVQDIIIGRRDRSVNYEPAVDLTDFGGKLFGVSRRHATLNNRNGVLYITDHSTTNGTYVNGKRIDPEIPHVLTNGDRLQVGRVHLMVKFVDRVLAT